MQNHRRDHRQSTRRDCHPQGCRRRAHVEMDGNGGRHNVRAGGFQGNCRADRALKPARTRPLAVGHVGGARLQKPQDQLRVRPDLCGD